MTAAADGQGDREYVVVNGWLAEVVNEHTCGTGPDGYYGAHEPGCGLVPVAKIADLLARPADEDGLRAAQRDVIELLAARLDQLAAGNPDGGRDSWAKGYDDGWNSARLQINDSILNPRVSAHIRAVLAAQPEPGTPTAEAQLRAIEEWCLEQDALSKGESPTTAAIRAARRSVSVTETREKENQ